MRCAESHICHANQLAPFRSTLCANIYSAGDDVRLSYDDQFSDSIRDLLPKGPGLCLASPMLHKTDLPCRRFAKLDVLATGRARSLSASRSRNVLQRLAVLTVRPTRLLSLLHGPASSYRCLREALGCSMNL